MPEAETLDLTFKEGQFYTNKGIPINDELAKNENVQLSAGRVHAVFGFGNTCSGFETVECQDFKSMKADTFVLCSNLHFAR